MKIKSITLVFLLAAISTLITNCAKAPEFPPVPEIAFVGFDDPTIVQRGINNPKDTLEITFSFTDGDGDIGDEDELNIFLTDSRDDLALTFKVNPIPEQGIGNGISGEITLRIPNDQICCIFPDGRTCDSDPAFPTDKMFYSIQLKDRFGNESNIVQTDEITILCE